MLTVFWKKLEAKSHNSVTETTVLQIHKINETYYVPRPLVLYNEICLCSDDTLSFGYAPKEVIDRFGSFCSKYATTASAIDGLLELKKNLKYMYEFLCDSVTCEMLLKLPSNENIRRLREAVYSLCEHTASMRYDDFNSSIEEIAMQLDSLQTPDALCTQMNTQMLMWIIVITKRPLLKVLTGCMMFVKEQKKKTNNSNGKSFNKSIRNKVTYDSTGGRPKKGVCGLKNLGNTCFMNCIYQCLFKTVELADYFLTNKYENKLNRKEEKSWQRGGKIAQRFADLLKQYLSGKYSDFKPTDLKEILKLNRN